MEWIKGEIVGRGSFGTVNLATPRNVYSEIPSIMAVKSSILSQSSMLHKEKELLTTRFNGCPQILKCFGDDHTIENGVEIYNVFLELASRGNLSQLIRSSGNSIPEFEIRRITRSITRGICYIHGKGYVHCDIKPQNLLLCGTLDGEFDVKIADFGLSKKTGEEFEGFGFVGTPLYMSPESISCNEHESPSDVWALGCVISEMITGKPAWKCSPNADINGLLFRIGFSEEIPEIPGNLSEEGKDFLRKCFVRDPRKRWTAEMLLNHPFIAVTDDDDTVTLVETEKASPSPRSAFDFPEWSSSHLSSIERSKSDSSTSFRGEFDRLGCSSSSSLMDRIRRLSNGEQPNWSSSYSWITVRETGLPCFSKLERFQ